MTNTLLIDLDDTLLLNPFDRFMPAYLKLLADKLSPFVAPDIMIPQLMYATDQMIQNNSPAQTLEETFDANFYPPLGLSKSDLEPHLFDFYTHEFHQLQSITSMRPEALELIAQVRHNSWQIVVATNPLFPLIAMQNRLSWAGFSQNDFPFSFVTAYESMHFAKPNPAYYAEILGRFGWPHQAVGMIGNNLNEDILPTSALGIPGFWVDQNIDRLPIDLDDRSSAGSLQDALTWVSKLNHFNQEYHLSERSSIKAVLTSTPAVLDTLVGDLDESIWKEKASPQELSLLEMVSHLLDVENEINYPRMQLILNNHNPTIIGVDSDHWIKLRDYQHSRSISVLSEFIVQRQQLISLLEGLSPDQWVRPAQHTMFGPTTLEEICRFIAQHDMDHIRQIHLVSTKLNSGTS